MIISCFTEAEVVKIQIKGMAGSHTALPALHWLTNQSKYKDFSELKIYATII